MLTWAERSTAPGVILAKKLDTDADILPYRYANAPNGMAQYNELIKRVVRHTDPDGSSCLRLNIVANDPVNGGWTQGQAWRSRLRPADVWPNDGDGIGTQEFWTEFALRIPPSRLALWDPTVPNSNSWKFAIMANMGLSNPIAQGGSSNGISHVLTNKPHRGRGFPVAYYHNDLNTNGMPNEGIIPGVSGNDDLNLAPGWDKGPTFTNYLDRYCAYSDPRGCPLWPTDVWIRFKWRIHVATYGGTVGNAFDLWWALPGDASWTLLNSARDYLAGTGDALFTGGFNGIWLTAFETNRPAAVGVDTVLDYRELLVYTQDQPFPDARPGTQPGGGQVAADFVINVTNPSDTVKVITRAEYDAMASQIQVLQKQVQDLTQTNAALTQQKAAVQTNYAEYVAAVKAAAQAVLSVTPK